MIEKLKKLFGGWSGISRQKTETRRIKYRWMISSSRAASVLRLVSPYIVTKPEEVQVAIDYAATVRGDKLVGADVLVLREKYRQLLMNLHHWRADPSPKETS